LEIRYLEIELFVLYMSTPLNFLIEICMFVFNTDLNELKFTTK